MDEIKKYFAQYKIITQNDIISVPKAIMDKSGVIGNLNDDGMILNDEIDFSGFSDKTMVIFFKITIHLYVENNHIYEKNFWDNLDLDEETFIELMHLCEIWEFVDIKKIIFFNIYLPKFYHKFNFEIINLWIKYGAEEYHQEIIESTITRKHKKIVKSLISLDFSEEDKNGEKNIFAKNLYVNNFKMLNFDEIENIDQIKHICFGSINIFANFINAYVDKYKNNNKLKPEKLMEIILHTKTNGIYYHSFQKASTKYSDVKFEIIGIKFNNHSLFDVIKIIENIETQFIEACNEALYDINQYIDSYSVFDYIMKSENELISFYMQKEIYSRIFIYESFRFSLYDSLERFDKLLLSRMYKNGEYSSIPLDRFIHSTQLGKI